MSLISVMALDYKSFLSVDVKRTLGVEKSSCSFEKDSYCRIIQSFVYKHHPGSLSIIWNTMFWKRVSFQ